MHISIAKLFVSLSAVSVLASFSGDFCLILDQKLDVEESLYIRLSDNESKGE